MVAGVIDQIQKRGVRDTTQKILQHVRSIFRYAQAKGLRPDDPADPVIEILKRAPDVVHHPALLTFPELGDARPRGQLCTCVKPAGSTCQTQFHLHAGLPSAAAELEPAIPRIADIDTATAWAPQ
jgi:hypothetical protein